MGEFIPDYLVREQATVGALVVFGVLRLLAAMAACHRGWPIGAIQKGVIGAAALYCAPQLLDLLTHPYALPAASAQFEGKALGAAVALFLCPILSHRLGYE